MHSRLLFLQLVQSSSRYQNVLQVDASQTLFAGRQHKCCPVATYTNNAIIYSLYTLTLFYSEYCEVSLAIRIQMQIIFYAGQQLWQ